MDKQRHFLFYGTDVEKAKIKKYNDVHPMKPSDNTAFDAKTLERQAVITRLTKEQRAAERQAIEQQAKDQQADRTVEAAATEPSL